MASLRQIRRSLRSVQNTKQIMRAMQLVSASKLKRAQGRLMEARQTLEFLDGLLQRVLRAAPGLRHPLCARDDARESALVLFTSDTGLCGSYNVNLIQLADAHLRRETARRTQVIYIGKKGHRYFTKRGFPAAESYLDLAGRPNLAKAEAVGRALIQRFLTGRVGSIHLLYMRFRSASSYEPTLRPWLPIAFSPQSIVHSPQQDYIFEPSPRRVFEDLLPRWALATFQCLMLEAFTSEHSARMIAMKNATDNAEDIIERLTMQRNKIRQAAITKELSEIVGTAEALK